MIKLTLKINKYITNFSYMFNECKTLKSFPDDDNKANKESINYDNASEETSDFSDNIPTDEISKISLKRNNTNSTIQSKLSCFNNDLSELITSKVKNISYMLNGCESL